MTTQAPLPEVEAVQEILLTMKGALSALGVSFSDFGFLDNIIEHGYFIR